MVNVDLLSPISSTVKIRILTHKNIFVDHLAFVKDQNDWKIVSKV